MPKKILIIIDGLGDIPCKALGNKTPLEAAKTPNLDFLAKNGKTGLLYPIKGVAPESDASQLAILGYNLKDYPGRGPLEALGSGINLKKGEIALRCNFAKIKGKKITSTRAEAPKKRMINEINRIHSDIKIIPTVSYRAVMLVKNASKEITNTHPGYIRYKNISKAITPKLIEKQCKGHPATAQKINFFLKEAKKNLKNKTILIRGAGYKPKKANRLKGWAMIADMPVELGIGRLFGMQILKRKNLQYAIKQAAKCKKNIYVQLKGPDIPSHLGNIKQKIKEIEKIDRALKPLTDLNSLKNCILCITSDHATPCKLKRHSSHPVPLLILGKGKIPINKFSEKSCGKGSLERIEGNDLMGLL